MSESKGSMKWLLLLVPVLVVAYLVWPSVMPEERTTVLRWNPPTLTEGDEPLTGLAGYNIHCWANAGRYTFTAHIEDPDVTSFAIQEPSEGYYYCAVSAFNDRGDESALSNIAARSVH